MTGSRVIGSIKSGNGLSSSRSAWPDALSPDSANRLRYLSARLMVLHLFVVYSISLSKSSSEIESRRRLLDPLDDRGGRGRALVGLEVVADLGLDLFSLNLGKPAAASSLSFLPSQYSLHACSGSRASISAIIFG